jgi:hypothetical protein
VLEDCQRFCYQVRRPVTFIDIRPNQDALEGSGGPDEVPTKDRRLKQLKFLIKDGCEKEKFLEDSKWVLQISGRIHLTELTATYEAEKAVPTKRGQPTVKERFTDLLFPHTIKHKEKKDRKRKKGRKVSDQQGQQMSGEEVRAKAERKLEYWLCSRAVSPNAFPKPVSSQL